MQIGTTFDPGHAKGLGLKPLEALDKIIKQGLSPIRVGIQWDKVEKDKGQFDFTLYDEILGKLAKADVEVVLTVGAKSPRYPEFFVPGWARERFRFPKRTVIDNRSFQVPLFKYIDETLERYKKFKSIKWLQVENEPFDWFGPDQWTFSYNFLREEIDFAKSVWDLPVICSTSGLSTTPLPFDWLAGHDRMRQWCLELGDIVGLEVYPKMPYSLFSWKFILSAGRARWWKLKRWFEKIKRAGKEAWVMELQAEPWEWGEWDFEDAYANKSCTPADVKRNLEKLKDIGFEKALLWGNEFWLACEERGNGEWVSLLETK